MRNYKGKKSNKGAKRDKQFDKSAQYKVESRTDGTTKHNDAAWYIKGAQMVLDAGRLAYAQPVGADIDLGSTDYEINDYRLLSDQYHGHMRVPGVMELRYVPVIGNVVENSDPVNISMRNIYSFIRHANSGHTNYDAPDLMLYLLSMDSIYQFYAHMCRTYGLVRMYSQTNRHLPFTVFKAIGVDYEDIMTNMSDFRAYINTFAARISSFAVPNTMDYFTRHLWMASGIYMDSPSTKAQAYIFTPGILGKYNEYDGAGRMDYIPTMALNREFKYSDFVAMGNDMLNAIVASEDIGIMSGDILKAYTQDQLIKVLPIADDFTIIPAYSEEVLRQIQNATVFDGSISFRSDYYIYQDVDTNTLRSGVELNVHNKLITGKRFMLSNVESPSPEEVMVDSRLSVLGSIRSTGSGSASQMPYYVIDVTSMGSEVIYGGWIHNIDKDGVNFVSIPFETYSAYGNGVDVGKGNLTDYVNMVSQITCFHNHPFIYAAFRLGTDLTAEPARLYTVGDIDNYTVVDDIEIAKLHTAALLSLFHVPQIAK